MATPVARTWKAFKCILSSALLFSHTHSIHIQFVHSSLWDRGSSLSLCYLFSFKKQNNVIMFHFMLVITSIGVAVTHFKWWKSFGLKLKWFLWKSDGGQLNFFLSLWRILFLPLFKCWTASKFACSVFLLLMIRLPTTQRVKKSRFGSALAPNRPELPPLSGWI